MTAFMWTLQTPKLSSQCIRFDGDLEAEIVHSLSEGQIDIINAVEWVDWRAPIVQFSVCEGCGISRCLPGNYVTFRRAGEVVLWMPAFEDWIDEPNEYWPPAYLLERGAIAFEMQKHESLREKIPSIPATVDVSQLSGWEAAKIFQLDTPKFVLERMNQAPRLLKESIVASSEGDFARQVQTLEHLVETLVSRQQPVRVRSLTEQEEIITFYMDISSAPTWNALCQDGDRYSLYLEPEYAIEF